MDIKINFAIISILLLSGCDPQTKTSFVIKNETSNSLTFFTFSDKDSLSISSGNQLPFLIIEAIGGDFSAISDYDSVLINIENDGIYLWKKPDNIYGYIDEQNSIGKSRMSSKDFYNSKDWTRDSSKKSHKWIFTFGEDDLF